MSSIIGRGKRPAAASEKYELYLDEIDALIGKIFALASINLQAVMLNQAARQYFNEENESLKS
jgi:hypothetical protein